MNSDKKFWDIIIKKTLQDSKRWKRLAEEEIRVNSLNNKEEQ
jgi:hypothetical protein